MLNNLRQTFNRRFILMFSIFMLLNFNFTILRSLRTTISVVDLGTGAHFIPFFELFGAMPAAFFMTWGLARLMNKLSIEKVIFWTLTGFLGFFLAFAFLVYPALAVLKKLDRGEFLLQGFAMLFYLMSELWKPALATILFWGLINQYLPILEAKKLYGPLMLGGSLGSIVAAPFITFCTSEISYRWFSLSSEKWTHSFSLLIFLITCVGTLTGILYYRLWKSFSGFSKNTSVPPQISLKESMSTCLQSQPLKLLAWIIIADYVAYSLVEVIFLDAIKIKFSQAADYCYYMGQLALWSGILTLISGLLITPYILQHCRWRIAALVTPISLLLTAGLFFISLQTGSCTQAWFGWEAGEWVNAVILFGSIQYCLCRAAKYTLFDSSKELAFVWMPDVIRMKGKLCVDGLCARLGRGGGSLLNLSLIQFSGGVLAGSPFAGVIALTVTLSWAVAAYRLDSLLERSPLKNANFR